MNALEIEEDRWRAVVSRASERDGEFVYAVVSTGVFCRPGCPSRRPSRANVRFFPEIAEAERVGFRACLRCRPGEARPQVQAVEKACRYLEEHVDERVTLEDLGVLVGMSPFHLQRVFKKQVGLTPRQYAETQRLQKLKLELVQSSGVAGACFGAGYGSSSRVYEKSDANLGMTPGTFQRGGKGMTVRYTIADCTLGKLLVAATERGVCAVQLGDDEEELRAALVDEFPAAELVRDFSGLEEWTSAIVRELAGEKPASALPLDIQATAFQRIVWAHLQSIPAGTTQTYGEIARHLGQPTAARAVARACATNPVSVVIPCHRVIRNDGGLGGYRWGIGRKKTMLEAEKERTQSARQREFFLKA